MLSRKSLVTQRGPCLSLLALVLVVSACAPAVASTPEKVVVKETVVVAGTPQVKEVVVTPTANPNAIKPAPAGSLLINGAGATFPFPLYSRWFYEYAFVDPAAKFNYQSIGSGGGIQQITAKTVDFGASDAILNDAQFKAAPGIQMFPMVAGAVVPVYNIKEITQGLKLDYTVVADIFLGKITKWDDPAIKKSNPDLPLPNKDIIVVHRSDGSGTTFIFTDYLSAVSQEWKDKVGVASSVKWPVGLGGKGNEGVAGTVQQNDGAMGYVELAYAKQNKLPMAALQNKAGTYVVAEAKSTQAAMTDFGGDMPKTLARSIVDAPGKDSWPIAGYTYLLVYMDQQDCAKAAKVVSFIKWGLSDGTKYATDLDYVPLPENVKNQVLAKLGEVTCQGKPIK